MGYPVTRPRRLRQNKAIREMVAGTALDRRDLIYPLFIDEAATGRKPVPSMPGVERLSLADLDAEADEVAGLGIPAVLLFGLPAEKDPEGEAAWRPGNVIEKSIKALKRRHRDLIVMADVCLCEYTTHGHCGPLRNGKVDNDAALDAIAKAALGYARAGADVVAPSGMMDGMVHAIRSELDFHGLKETIIMSYAAKYASALYGPFREAAGSGCREGDRSTYQMDPANADEALREIALDLEEGADIVMVKPALSYLDIVYRAKAEFRVPVAAYHVSGEYAMLRAAAASGWIDGDRAALEALLCMKRAGADLIVTYCAKEIARRLGK